MDDIEDTRTKLLTLLNVSATKLGKRKWNSETETRPGEKLNKRKAVSLADSDVPIPPTTAEETGQVEEETGEDVQEPESINSYEEHFGCNPSILTEKSRASADRLEWILRKSKRGSLGASNESVLVESSSDTPSSPNHGILQSLWSVYQTRQANLDPRTIQLQTDLLSTLASYRDFYSTAGNWDTKKSFRESISLHALNHVTRKRRRVLKNNERLTHASKSSLPPPEDVQDQGFTRPSVLILLPFRASALAWFKALTSHTPTPLFQIENQSRFLAEYELPPGTTDKLASAEPGAYPRDHVENFKGNIDDNFRIGIKLTRKSVKMFSDFYGCDIIMASPLGLRQSMQKERNSDYLSSIEILVMDQIDCLTMQNWEHVKFVLSRLNQMPKESHDADFSRIKPWYLDAHAEYLRQTILLTAYETPEVRSLYNNLKNVAGKIRLQKKWHPIQVPEGIDQSLIRFDCSSAKDEVEKRFSYFTTQLLPAILKSAVQSANAVIFIPSSFDFIRVHNYFRKQSGASFAVLSEYSTNQDISRARQAFFSGQKAILLISERFHFYKRYKIRGIRNIIFYGPPDHPEFYSELLSYPFLDDGVDGSDVTCRVLYSRYDWLRMERITGTDQAVELFKSV